MSVVGTIPPDLNGRFVRNGPNPASGTSPHWFLGDGMLHGVQLRDGRADWYRNRLVRTKSLSGEGTYVDDQGHVDFTVGPANTHIVRHAGRMLALVESGFPYEVTATLDTVGCYDFDGRLTTPMTAHPKLDPVSGELHFFGYSFVPPFLTYHVADRDGTLVRSEAISVPGPTMIHDFNLTERHVVFMDLPVVFDLDLAVQGTMPYRWDDDYGARLGVMPRGGTDADVQALFTSWANDAMGDTNAASRKSVIVGRFIRVTAVFRRVMSVVINRLPLRSEGRRGLQKTVVARVSSAWTQKRTA